jgi:hypothetical protein
MAVRFAAPFRGGIAYSENVTPAPSPGLPPPPPDVTIARGTYFLPEMDTARLTPSSGHQLASMGFEVGLPRDDHDRPFSSPAVLMEVSVRFFVGATSFTRARQWSTSFLDYRVAVFLDNDRGQGFEAGALVLAHDEGFAFFDSSESVRPSVGPRVEQMLITSTLVPTGTRYRVFADLRRDIRAAGFGGFGGSRVFAASGEAIITAVGCRWLLAPL